MREPTRVHAFKELKALGPETMSEIDDRLLRKATPLSVAKWIQGEMGGCLHVKEESLKKTLERYRKTELRDRVVNSVIEMNRKQAGYTVAGKLHAMSELEELVAIQRGRFHKLLVKEQGGPLLMGGVSSEAKLLMQMLERLGAMQFDAGVIPRAPKVIAGTITDTSTGETTEFSWTEEQERLYRDLERTIEHEPA